MIARELCRRSSPDTFHNNRLEDNRNYADLLRRAMDYVNVGGHSVILTPGRYNAAYFEKKPGHTWPRALSLLRKTTDYTTFPLTGKKRG